MPRGDGTGPTGQGPTGGGRQGSVGGGRGQGRGLRRGGRGWRNWPVGIEQPLPVDAPHIEEMPAVPIAPVAAETEVALLRGQLQECQQAMAALNERILQLSENQEIAGIIPIGYPDENPVPPERIDLNQKVEWLGF